MSEFKDRTELLRIFSDALMEYTDSKVQLHTDWTFEQLVMLLANPNTVLSAFQALKEARRHHLVSRYEQHALGECCPQCFVQPLKKDERPERPDMLICAGLCGYWCPEERSPIFACEACKAPGQTRYLFSAPTRSKRIEWWSRCTKCLRETEHEAPKKYPPAELPPVRQVTRTIEIPAYSTDDITRIMASSRSISDLMLEDVVRVTSPQNRNVRFTDTLTALELDFDLTCVRCQRPSVLYTDFSLQCSYCRSVRSLEGVGTRGTGHLVPTGAPLLYVASNNPPAHCITNAVVTVVDLEARAMRFACSGCGTALPGLLNVFIEAELPIPPNTFGSGPVPAVLTGMQLTRNALLPTTR